MRRGALQRLLLVLVILPFWTSYLLRVYSWLNILGDGGAINRFLQWTHLTDHPVSFFLYDRPAVILVLVYLYFPFAVLTLYASLERFDWDQFKAAMDLGATPRTAITRILLPQIRPGITTAVIFVFIPILGEYLAPQLVGGARGVMIGNLIVNFFTGAAVHARRRGGAADRGADRRAARRSSGARSRWRTPTVREFEVVSPHARLVSGLLGGWAVLIYVFLFAPIVLLVLFSFNANSTARSRSPAGRRTGTGRSSATTRSRTRSRRRSKVALRGDGDRDGRRDGGGVPARPLAAAVPERRSGSG